MREKIGRIVWIATLLASGFAFGQQAPRNKPDGIGPIAIGTIGPPGLPSDLRSKLEDATASGLMASGADVISPTEISRVRTNAGLGSCSDSICERRTAELARAQYWLRGTCQLDVSTYHLHLELVEARSGTVRVARDDTCDICTENDVALMANVAASALKVSLARMQPAPAPVVSPTPVPLVSPSGQTPIGKGSGGSISTAAMNTGAADGARPLWRRLLPWAAFAAAATAGAGGAYYLAINNRGVERCNVAKSSCAYVNDTLWQWGVPLLGAAAALGTTGVILLTMRDRPPRHEPPETSQLAAASTTPQIIISLDRIAISGRF